MIEHGCNGGQLVDAVRELSMVGDLRVRVAQFVLLAEDHKGMRADYSGMFKQARLALARGGKEPGLAEMLRQLQEHITELGTRWYAGDTAVVDELLQLYCVEKGARDALVAATPASSVADAAGAKPEYMTVSQAPTSQYAQGRNDCLAAGASNECADAGKEK